MTDPYRERGDDAPAAPQYPSADPYPAAQPYPPADPYPAASSYSPPPPPTLPAPPPTPYQGAAAPAPYQAAYSTTDPLTGQPYSDKSKVTAGLLQLLPGFFFGLGGIGRLYAGNTNLGVTQIVASIFGWICLVCGVFLLFPLLITFGIWLWFVIDGILMLAGRPVDAQGRVLRP